MEMNGEYQIPARREVVWAALNDPAVLKACIPGCEALTRTEDGRMNLTVRTRIGPTEAVFAGTVTFADVLEPERCTMLGEADGGPAGAVKGAADVQLVVAGEGTILSYALKAQVGSQLAQLGSRLIDTSAKTMANAFFAAFAARLGGELTVIAPPLATPGPDEAAEDELVDRIEHRVDDEAENVSEIAEEVEQELEVAAGRGVLGGPYVWGLIALLVVIVALAIMR
ncbi:carbon monoxide dehydrogenase subunit G [Mesorhizobium sp. BR1-1-16]|uniref:SRPBCC family protein n=1 Tax=Mesorhizobium sp. BR1-1-16 TaxID=2876653 RepID=UPI001CC9DBD8|nr:carbon monoxide dehydrogenase subunit G [Mesorhizobium sp. BR1-1-16]MBZ9938505.1 carbon monoxide dehydrogenase subunit G [Mesorhizobium sp. BR1-1-16]